MMREKGTYALVIALPVMLRLRIGKLGIQSLSPGYYVYVGSALGGLCGKLSHHLGPKKRLHWHIDYLLAKAEIAEIWYALGCNRHECIWNTMLGDLPGAKPSVPGFGASDCRCQSHLTHFPWWAVLYDRQNQNIRTSFQPVRRLVQIPTAGVGVTISGAFELAFSLTSCPDTTEMIVTMESIARER
jgi:Uri superfamily endonuclease